MNQRLKYGKWTIYYSPTPLPTRAFDWSFYHDDFDGADDANDCRCGAAASPEACIAEIQEIEQ